ncbi:hypothetical protein [Streptomyces sp. NPDC001250]|uniref:hypothetical protein n=1 Tax=unclassified Streptomyces TaxID=2593676 RepID=UPI003321533B
MFVEVPDFPNVSVVVDAVSYTPHGKIVDSTEWPTIGSLVEGVVVDHVEHNREIKLRVE